MRIGLPLLLMMTTTLGVASNASAQSGVVAYAGDLQSIDRATLEAAELSLPPTAGQVARAPMPAAQHVVKPAAHAMAVKPPKTEPQTAKQKVGLLDRMKNSWRFGKREEKPATDPFQAAKLEAKQKLVQRGAAVGPIPAFVPQNQKTPVETAGYHGRLGEATTAVASGGPVLRQGPATRGGILSGLFGGSSEPSTPAASTPARVASQAKPKPKTSTVVSARSKTRPGGSVARSAPKPPQALRPRTTPQPKPAQLAVPKRVTPKRMTPKPNVKANPYATKSPPAGAMVMISDDGPAAPAPKPIAKPAAKPMPKPAAKPAPKVIAKQTAPKPLPPKPLKAAAPKLIASATPPYPTAPDAKPATLPKVVAAAPKPTVLPPAPKPMPLVTTPKKAEPVAEYAKTTPALSIARGPLPSRPAPPAEPTERAKNLLAEAHELAATAGDYDEFTAVVKRCRYVLAIDKSPTAQAYANQLAGWALTKRGEVLDDDGRVAEAEVDYHDALRCDPECWRAEHALGVQAARRGEAEAALRRFNRTIGLNPEYAKAFSNRAALGVQAGDYRAALNDYAEAIAIDPDLAVAHTGRGRVCHMLGMLDDGLRHLDAAELLSPDDAMIASGRGDLLTDLGRYGQAIAAYQRAITLDPDSPVAYRNLAWTQATCPTEAFRDGAAALRNAERAEQLSASSDDLILDTKAAALAAMGRFDEAASLQKQAVELAPESDAPAYRARLAMYERSESFTSRPMDIEQATYTR